MIITQFLENMCYFENASVLFSEQLLGLYLETINHMLNYGTCNKLLLAEVYSFYYSFMTDIDYFKYELYIEYNLRDMYPMKTDFFFTTGQ